MIASTRLLTTLQFFDQEKPPYTSVVRELGGDGSTSVLIVRDLPHA